MKLELLEDISPEKWDREIEGYDSKFLFHQSAWLNFLRETQGGDVLRFKIVDEGRVEGYFAGLVINKGPLHILGSPLQGWTTDYMGPIVNRGFDNEEFLHSLDEMCRKLNIHHVELCNPFLDSGIMSEMGFGVSEGITYVVALSQDEDEMWNRLDKKSCQYSIRKARKTNLRVSENYASSFINEYYRQLEEVFGKQKLIPTYGIKRIEALFRNLSPELLLALEVKYGDRTVATGIFPHDARCVYFFGGASWLEFHKLCPNEMLHWALMTHCGKIGISRYDMCGKGSFKPKFGGQKMSVCRYSKSYSLLAKLGREMYRSLFFARQKMAGKYLHVTRRFRTHVSADE